MVGLPAGQTEKLGIEPATAQLELGLGLSLAKIWCSTIFNDVEIDDDNYSTCDRELLPASLYQPSNPVLGISCRKALD